MKSSSGQMYMSIQEHRVCCIVFKWVLRNPVQILRKSVQRRSSFTGSIPSKVGSSFSIQRGTHYSQGLPRMMQYFRTWGIIFKTGAQKQTERSSCRHATKLVLGARSSLHLSSMPRRTLTRKTAITFVASVAHVTSEWPTCEPS